MKQLLVVWRHPVGDYLHERDPLGVHLEYGDRVTPMVGPSVEDALRTLRLLREPVQVRHVHVCEEEDGWEEIYPTNPLDIPRVKDQANE